MNIENGFFPRSLAKLPSLDFFNPSEDGGGGGGTVFDTVNFKMISSNSSNSGTVINYSELKMESPADGGTNPISSENDTERAMLVVSLPKPGDAYTMSLNLANATASDTVGMAVITGNFADMRAGLPAGVTPIFEEADLFYTLQISSTSFETYVNINQASEVAKLSYTHVNTFDTFRVQLLALSNA